LTNQTTQVQMQPERRSAADQGDLHAVADALHRNGWCHNPAKDVVVPTFWEAAPTQHRLERSTRASGEAAEAAEAALRRTPPPGGCSLLFGGDPRLDYAAYSGGVRQLLWRKYKGDKLGSNTLGSDKLGSNASASSGGGGICMERSVPEEAWRDARFALAVSGDGWGNRFMKGALLGTVPLVAAPHARMVRRGRNGRAPAWSVPASCWRHSWRHRALLSWPPSC